MELFLTTHYLWCTVQHLNLFFLGFGYMYVHIFFWFVFLTHLCHSIPFFGTCFECVVVLVSWFRGQIWRSFFFFFAIQFRSSCTLEVLDTQRLLGPTVASEPQSQPQKSEKNTRRSATCSTVDANLKFTEHGAFILYDSPWLHRSPIQMEKPKAEKWRASETSTA